MRKAQKVQIKQIILLLQKSHEVIKKYMSMGEMKKITGLLQECQEATLAIVSQLERNFSCKQNKYKIENGDKTEIDEKISKNSLSKNSDIQLREIITILQDYSNYLYQFYENIETVSNAKVEQIIMQADILLQKVEQYINAIKEKKMVVFLPYKASMWDSLESVWKSAEEDENCEVYVMPIPYFDRKEDGSFGELHYEGTLYPKNVPITDYRAFDLEEQRPNMIYIHNPYDEYNRVTSVHPDFYSKKLKEYTEKLIYIPYFVLEEISPENEVAVEHIAHFCKVPAVLNADKVIVQSEQMKQVYVKVLTDWMGEHTRGKWEEKILGLGSPKMDKVANIKKEDLEIPKTWNSIIEKQDGTWKKIIFYNTSLSTFLEYSDRYLEKLEDALKLFKQEKEQIALLWRPHPLMQSTIQSMRPKVAEQYIRIVKRYKEENWGIYDDTPDLDRAIGLADAYYGDPSSVVQLCQKVGLPIMIQNVEVRYE